MVDVPVSPAVLRWAREYRGLDEASAAKKLDIGVRDLRAYESGERVPTISVFENFANTYKLPQATLFRDTPPKLAPSPVDYRTLGGERHGQSFESRVLLSQVRGSLAELRRIAAEDEEFNRPKLPHYSSDGDPESLGMKERERFGIGNEQTEWRADEAFRRWRAAVEKQGVSVFVKKYPWADSRGFSLFDDAATPAIVINKNETADVARSFSLFHEYAHLLIRKPGVSDHNPNNPVEAFCNRFAAAFLMPDVALKELLPYWPNEPVEWSAIKVAEWARKLKVSQAALALRLEQAGLAPEGFFARFNRPPPPPPPPREGPIKVDPIVVRLFELGGNFPGSVMAAYDRGAISEITAVQALGLSADYFDRVRESVTRHRAMAGA